jgi:stearoyl-CoA desaturase (delta-9 desaturase)
MFKLSKPLEYFFRFVLWLSMVLPQTQRWDQLYAAKHRKHHVTSDTVADPHSPYHQTFKQMTRPFFDPKDIEKYSAGVETPNDWMQKVLQEKYKRLGPLIMILLTFWLFGIGGVIISLVMHFSTANHHLETFIGNYANHKLGFRYAGNRFRHDRSTILFPLGILLAGEELHANHHNNPGSPSFRNRWFELDMGYVYAVIFSKLGLLEIIERK